MSVNTKKLGEDQLGSFELGVSTHQATVTTEGSSDVTTSSTIVTIPNSTETKIGSKKLGNFTLGNTDKVTQPVDCAGATRVNAVGTGASVGKSNVLGSSTTSVSGTKVDLASVTLSSFSDIEGCGTTVTVGDSSFDGSSSAAIVGTKVLVTDPLSLDGNGDISATGAAINFGSANFSGSGKVTPIGIEAVFDSATLFGSNEIEVIGENVILGVTTLGGSANTDTTGTQVVIPKTTKTKLGEETLGSFSLGDGVQVTPVSYTGSAEVDSDGTKVSLGSGTLSGETNISVTGTPVILREADLYGSSSLSAKFVNIGSVTMSGSGNALPAGTKTKIASIQATGSGTLEPNILTVNSVYTVLGMFNTSYSIDSEFDIETVIEGDVE